jgi:hypothetical protein
MTFLITIWRNAFFHSFHVMSCNEYDEYDHIKMPSCNELGMIISKGDHVIRCV